MEPADAPESVAPESVPPSGFRPGSSVLLAQTQPYLKTADPMPMLRPPDLVEAGAEGVVVAVRAQGVIAVRFRRGTFLVPADQLLPSPKD